MLNDIRDALRAYLRAPGFTLTAAFTLAVGIGANTAIFSVVYALLLKPLPFREPGQIVYVHDTFPAVGQASLSWRKAVALRDGNHTLASLAALSPGSLTMTSQGEPLQIATTRVSGDFFDVFGVPPLAGRTITRDDDVPGGGAVIVLGYGLWQRTFGGTAVVGRRVIADGQPRTIVGVMPAGFQYPTRGEAWVPLALPPTTADGDNFLRLVGRMKPDVSLAQAGADLKAVTAAYNAANNAQRDVAVYRLQDYLAQGNRQIVLVLQGAVMLVLLIACANVANMLLARSVSRRRELAIRAALGAGPARLLRQLLTESVMLAAAGGALGVLLGGWLLRFFLALAPAGFAGMQPIVIDRQALAFTAAVAMLTGIVFGVAPARRGFHTESQEALRDASARGGSTSPRGRGASRLLVVSEIALAVVLLVGAGLFVKSLIRLQAQEAGFRPDGLMTFQLALPPARYDDDRLRRTVARILAEIGATPGVKAAGAVNFLPLLQFGYSGPFTIPGRPPLGQGDRTPVIEYRIVTPGYFAAMGIPMRRGATFTDRDGAGEPPVAIISETMARRSWPGADPIGARVQLAMDDGAITREIVGVVGDVRSQALNRVPVPEAYVPHAQLPIGTLSLAIRSDGDPVALLPMLRQRIAAIDAALPLVRPQTMHTLLKASAGSMRLSSTLTSVFAALAGLLAAVGIYSLVAYSVATRTREIGIRVALGAEPSSVLRLIVGEGLSLAAVGLLFGLAGAYSLVGVLQSMLFEVSALDPIVLVATTAAVLLVTALASLVPAWRVVRIDPTVALRSE